MTAARYFHELDATAAPLPSNPDLLRTRIDGSLIRFDYYRSAGGSQSQTLDGLMEAFVLPRDGRVVVTDTHSDTTMTVNPGAVALLRGARDARFVVDIEDRCIVAGMPARGGQGAESADAEPTVFVLEDMLEDKYEGWRFYALDGDFLTVGCSYRTAPPPSQETPHTHPGEQFNVAMEGLFEMTIGGVVHDIQRGWISHVPPETLHTGLHKRFPYFQLIFSTPPRGSDYDKFLAGIYEAEIEE